MECRGTGAVKPGERYTLDDWKKWSEDERWELINGIAYAMSPAVKKRKRWCSRI